MIPRRALIAAILSLSCACVAQPARGQEAPAVHFRPLDVHLDSGDRPLAAYQIEIVVTSGRAEIVGVEGGEHQAFHGAPYYDPAALNGGRIIIAAFNTGADLPKGKTRVATIHMQELGIERPEYEARLMAAASSAGQRIDAIVSLNRGQGGVR